jgi:hypothetical protein
MEEELKILPVSELLTDELKKMDVRKRQRDEEEEEVGVLVKKKAPNTKKRL